MSAVGRVLTSSALLWWSACVGLAGAEDLAAPRRLRSSVVAAQEELPDIEVVGVEAVKTWAVQRLVKGEESFSASGLPRQPSPDSWAGVVVYQIMPDRFNNGNLSNDFANMPQAQQEAMARNDWTGVPDWRHGGDLQGIRDRLGYLEDLGVQTLWITPVLMNDGGYHGYCNTDPTTTDPSFGSPEELRDLVADAHKHGITIVLDVVINHMCDTATAYASPPDHEPCAERWNEMYWNSTANNATGVGMNFSTSFFPPFRTTAFFNRCGANNVADTSGETPAAVFGDFVEGMFDYNTQNQDWQDIFTNLLKYWVAFADVDGLRLDAAKHVTTDFIAYLSTELRKYAIKLGKSNFLVIGEEASQEESWKALGLGRMMSDPEEPEKHGHVPQALTRRMLDLQSTYLANPNYPAPGLTSLYNFNMSGTARNALRCEQETQTVEDYFSSWAREILMAQAVPQKGAEPDAHLWTVVELHDWPRFLGLYPNRTDMLMAAVTWLLTAPGAPILYYGVEQAYNGKCPSQIGIGSATVASSIREVCEMGAQEKYGSHPDSLKRQDMFASGPWLLGSSIEAVDSLARITNTTPAVSKPWQVDEMLPRDHAMYRHTRRLVALRRSCPALTSGSIVWHEAQPVDCGFMAFSRLPFGERSDAADEVVVLINSGGGGEISLDSLPLNGTVNRVDGQRYVNVLNTSQHAQVRASDDGSMHLVVTGQVLPAGGIMVLVQEGRHLPFNETMGIALCNSTELTGKSAEVHSSGALRHVGRAFASSAFLLFVALVLDTFGSAP